MRINLYEVARELEEQNIDLRELDLKNKKLLLVCYRNYASFSCSFISNFQSLLLLTLILAIFLFRFDLEYEIDLNKFNSVS